MCSSCQPEELLEAAGLKATQQRVRVLGALRAAGEARTPQDLLAALRGQGPMDRVTLYRTLETLAASGLAARHEAGDGSARYCLAGPAHPDHAHFYCLRCKRLYCLDPGAVTVGADLSGVEHVSVRLEGACRQCREGLGGQAT